MSIAVKLIALNTLLLVLITALFGALNRYQTLRLIDENTARLQRSLSAALTQAGTASAKLLRSTAEQSLADRENIALQIVLEQVAKQDPRVLAVALTSPGGTYRSHNQRSKVGTPVEPALRPAALAMKSAVLRRVKLEGEDAQVFFAPVHDREQKKPLGAVMLAFSLTSLSEEQRAAQATKEAEAEANLFKLLLVGALCVLVGLLLTVVQGVRIIRPLQALAAQAEAIAGGDLSVRARIRTHDEIGVLGRRFDDMAEQLTALVRQAVDKAALEKELEVVSAIQATMAPDLDEARSSGLDLAAHSQPASRCGGDWWTLRTLERDRVLMVIGDATGHGTGAAMLTAAARGAAAALVQAYGGLVDLHTLVRVLNAAIYDTAQGKLGMTCFAALYDRQKETLYYTNSGHPFPYLHRLRDGKLLPLVLRGARLGQAELDEPVVAQTTLAKGDTLVLFTDGITEATNPAGEPYGERRFNQAIRRRLGLPSQDVCEGLVSDMRAFRGPAPVMDDITLLVARVL